VCDAVLLIRIRTFLLYPDQALVIYSYRLHD
jgi:hypothetical protein